jgi:hypothetical protein
MITISPTHVKTRPKTPLTPFDRGFTDLPDSHVDLSTFSTACKARG